MQYLKRIILALGLLFAISSIPAKAQISIESFISKIHYGMYKDELFNILGQNIKECKQDEALKTGDNTLVEEYKGYFNIKEKNFWTRMILSSDSDVITSIMINPENKEIEHDKSLCAYINNAMIEKYGAPNADCSYQFPNCTIGFFYSEENSYCTILFLLEKFSTTESVNHLENMNSTALPIKIQDEFLGIPFGKSYAYVKETMRAKGFHNTSAYNTLLYENVKFAGINWDYCSFEFNDKNQFSGITFQIYSNTGTVTLSRYKSLRERLTNKYSEDLGFFIVETDRWESEKNITTEICGMLYGTLSPETCSLKAFYGESQGKAMYYYLTLSYQNVMMMDNADEEL